MNDLRDAALLLASVLLALCSFTTASCSMGSSSSISGEFAHPGMLHTTRDLAFMKQQVAAGLEPWKSGYEVLTKNVRASLSWTPRATRTVVRGFNGKNKENYGSLYNDAAAAYALALRWHISGDDAFADRAVEILDAWASSLAHINGTSDRFLASGIYGYQLANAAELLRDYAKWSDAAFDAFVDMMLAVFYPMNHDFLTYHNGAKIDHYWANWDLANMASMLAIGILADRADVYDEAVAYFQHGGGNGAIAKTVWKIHPDGLGQVQESGRDQGHATLVLALLGAFCQMAYNQQCDLFAYDNNRVLAGAEYVARYNLGLDVNYTTYSNSDVTQPVISAVGRGNVRPVWELFYNHYVVKKGLSGPSVAAWAKRVRPEGGGGNYGSNSGGFDQLGYGTLVYSLGSSAGDSTNGSAGSSSSTPVAAPTPSVTAVPAKTASATPTVTTLAPIATPTLAPVPATAAPTSDVPSPRAPSPSGDAPAPSDTDKKTKKTKKTKKMNAL